MTGSIGRQGVSDDVFKKDLDFELPSFPEQEKISKILSTIDDLIDKYDSMIELTKKFQNALMKKLFSNGWFNHKKSKKNSNGFMVHD